MISDAYDPASPALRYGNEFLDPSLNELFWAPPLGLAWLVAIIILIEAPWICACVLVFAFYFSPLILLCVLVIASCIYININRIYITKEEYENNLNYVQKEIEDCEQMLEKYKMI